ncbi:hypothetical protein COS91_06995 [Candidatus Desantisbacteria bacterium CG07_land_8_20_14_0_80_39_15]|uniref:GP-PDE domain-containing protein n=2 Tax=unclassified Candidatus Desantisiibacteriota TaxID=3106372 RepID=A0A2H9PD94_9BACT|nr:MAG: hypothetical protein COS91_06995 [Candidatus Desantisbacteria bacterium CG07_land_8_20_14_0_80_39_15]PIZ17435.1 MAG: hypothetical protein COY51_00075 [Candidatus Desantisbacteria bacterium CG_4_10_14_0_8_um_filter_39_17]
MNKVKVVAHRGDPSFAPENTIPAIKMAVELGVDMIEFDVQMTKDRKFVLMHDGTVDSTTDGTGKVCHLTLKEIKALRAINSIIPDENLKWFKMKLQESEVPTLEEVLEVIPAPVQLNVHLKVLGPSVEGISEERLANVFKNRKELKERTFIAVDTVKGLEKIRRVDRYLNFILLEGQQNAKNYVSLCRSLGIKLLQPDRDLVSREFMDEVHVNGMRANVFWADTEKDIEYFISCGIDGILTNFPQRMIKLLSRK